jgi:hypothetical protein
MIVLIKNELSKTGMVMKVQRLNASRSLDGPRANQQEKRYRCLLTRPGRTLHASLTATTGGTVTVADLLRLLAMDRRGRKFLEGFKNSSRHLHGISIDERTNVKELMEICTG